MKEDRDEQHKKERGKVKDMLCMGVSKRVARGPNPLSIKKKAINKDASRGKKKRVRTTRRVRKGKRSKELSALKKEEKLNLA